jgi:hypothetical protein
VVVGVVEDAAVVAEVFVEALVVDPVTSVVVVVVAGSATVVVGALLGAVVDDGAVATSLSPSQLTNRRAAMPARIRNRILSGHG